MRVAGSLRPDRLVPAAALASRLLSDCPSVRRFPRRGTRNRYLPSGVFNRQALGQPGCYLPGRIAARAPVHVTITPFSGPSFPRLGDSPAPGGSETRGAIRPASVTEWWAE